MILRQYILDNMTVQLAVERYLNLFDSLHSNINFSNKKYYLKFLQREFYVRNIKKILLFKNGNIKCL